MKSLGDRMKAHESVAKHKLMKKIPVIVRVDGKAFHTLTRDLDKPFDDDLIKSMTNMGFDLAKEMQGFKLGYVASDEASFLLSDLDSINTEAWFDYKIDKINSVSAAYATLYFNKHFQFQAKVKEQSVKEGVFDCRCFNIPKEDVANYFLWRARDWERNSLQMYARSVFSHKELHGKGHSEIHDMLHKKEKNWATDLALQQKNGSWIHQRDEDMWARFNVSPSYAEISALVDPLLEPKDEEE